MYKDRLNKDNENHMMDAVFLLLCRVYRYLPKFQDEIVLGMLSLSASASLSFDSTGSLRKSNPTTKLQSSTHSSRLWLWSPCIF